VNRRDFITLLGGMAAAWPLAAHAQQALERVRRIGIMSGVRESDPDTMARYTALRQVLQQLGWTEGRNIQFDYRFGMAGNRDLMRKYVAELTAQQPDVILVAGTPTVGALQSATRTVPIVFAGIIDPVGSGLVASLARPGGNTTGFISYELRTEREMAGAAQRDCPRGDAHRRRT
jgi:putative ABC transport system substrate-binding protein